MCFDRKTGKVRYIQVSVQVNGEEQYFNAPELATSQVDGTIRGPDGTIYGPGQDPRIGGGTVPGLGRTVLTYTGALAQPTALPDCD
jgi:hypothetical protein